MLNMEKNKISIVVPCFNEKEALPLFYNKITQVFNQMSQESETAGLSYELIIVDDGSMDGTLDVAKELAVNDSGVKYISFSRNFGKEAAMYAGLQHAVQQCWNQTDEAWRHQSAGPSRHSQSVLSPAQSLVS